MTSGQEPVGDNATASGRRQGGRFFLWLSVGLSLIIVIYVLAYFSLRGYRHTDEVSLIVYGPQCVHLYGSPQKRAEFIYSVHALSRPSPFESMTGIHADSAAAWFTFTLVFVPIELLECALRDGL